MKILVIDDIVAIQEMISEYLTDLGHSVESRSDISEDDYKYDLLLCDLGSVRKFLISGGMCLLRGENPGLKVILISGSECMYSS
jgi:DNA-binding response OmpR family regulator